MVPFYSNVIWQYRMKGTIFQNRFRVIIHIVKTHVLQVHALYLVASEL